MFAVFARGKKKVQSIRSVECRVVRKAVGDVAKRNLFPLSKPSGYRE